MVTGNTVALVLKTMRFDSSLATKLKLKNMKFTKQQREQVASILYDMAEDTMMDRFYEVVTDVANDNDISECDLEDVETDEIMHIVYKMFAQINSVTN